MSKEIKSLALFKVFNTTKTENKHFCYGIIQEMLLKILSKFYCDQENSSKHYEIKDFSLQSLPLKSVDKKLSLKYF